MPHETVHVTPFAADPRKVTVASVGAPGSSMITWVEDGITISHIRFRPNDGDIPVAGATPPSAANNWTLTYPNPTSPVVWYYDVYVALDGVPLPLHDPEIDNVG